MIGVSISCDIDEDCSSNFGCEDGNCVHKSLFPLNWYEIIGSSLIFLSSGFANAAGIGGGGLFVIIFVTLFGYNPSDAVAMTQFNMVGGSLTAVLMKVPLKNPLRNSPLIDYYIVLQIIGPLFIGATIGVILNIVLPYWFIILALTSLLWLLCTNTIKSAIKKYKAETAARLNSNLIETGQVNTGGQLILPWKNIIYTILIFLFVALCSFIKGSRNLKSFLGIEFCSVWFWVATGILIIALLLISIVSIYHTFKNYQNKIIDSSSVDDKDMAWTKENCIMLGFSGFLAGLIGSVVGVGGAIVINPILLRIGVLPEVMTATSSFMILFNAGISSLQFAIAGKIELYYGLWTIFFSFFGSGVGVFLLKKLVDRYKRSSLIIILLAFLMGLCGVVLPIYGIVNLVNNNDDYGFHDYCNK